LLVIAMIVKTVEIVEVGRRWSLRGIETEVYRNMAINISDLLCEVLYQFNTVFNKGLSKTKLLKLTYLVEVFYKRRYKERITTAEWVYYLYGPYLRNYDALLQNKNIIIEKLENKEEIETNIVSITKEYKNDLIPKDAKYLIHSIVHDYGNLDLKDILNFVYFETEPMINAELRNEILDFNTILPEEHYKIKQLKIDPNVKKAIRSEFRKKIEAING